MTLIEKSLAEIFKALDTLRADIQEITERIDGLGHAPKELREEKFKTLMDERNGKLDEEMKLLQQIRQMSLHAS